MELISTPVRIAEADIKGQAKRKGGLIGLVMLAGSPLTLLRVEYKKYFRFFFPYEIVARVFPFRRREFNGDMEIIVDAISGSCAVNNAVDIELIQVEGHVFMDGTLDMEMQEAHDIAIEFGRRVLTRLGRSVPHFGECLEPDVFYRPFWIAYYGDPKDKKCRYLPFGADGHAFKR